MTRQLTRNQQDLILRFVMHDRYGDSRLRPRNRRRVANLVKRVPMGARQRAAMVEMHGLDQTNTPRSSGDAGRRLRLSPGYVRRLRGQALKAVWGVSYRGGM